MAEHSQISHHLITKRWLEFHTLRMLSKCRYINYILSVGLLLYPLSQQTYVHIDTVYIMLFFMFFYFLPRFPIIFPIISPNQDSHLR